MTREQAWQLVCEWTESDSLRKHMLAVEAAMRHYAQLLGQDVETWGVVGLLHDFDYERYPDVPAHTTEGAKALREMGVDEEIVACILSHADWHQDDYPREATAMRRALSAVDELTGFITAVALVRPSRSLHDLKAKSVRKKMKDKAFAAAVSRDDIIRGAALLELELNEHIDNVIAGMRKAADDLDLAGK
jgi:putative nucleotidyltransferase with HDIG domain